MHCGVYKVFGNFADFQKVVCGQNAISVKNNLMNGLGVHTFTSDWIFHYFIKTVDNTLGIKCITFRWLIDEDWEYWSSTINDYALSILILIKLTELYENCKLRSFSNGSDETEWDNDTTWMKGMREKALHWSNSTMHSPHSMNSRRIHGNCVRPVK